MKRNSIAIILLLTIFIQNENFCQSLSSNIHEEISATIGIEDVDSTQNLIREIHSRIKIQNLLVADSTLALLYLRMGQSENTFGNDKKADSLLVSSANLYEKLGDEKKILSVLYNRIILNSNLGLLELADSLVNQGLEKANEINDDIAFGKLIHAYSILKSSNGQYDSAVDLSIKAIDIFEKKDKTKEYLKSKLQLGMAMSHVDSEKAIAILKEIHLDSRLDSFVKVKINVVSNLGVLYGRMNNAETSLVYLKEGLKLAKQINYRAREIALYGSLANAYLVNKDFDKALDFYNKEYKLLNPESKFSLAINCLNKGMTLNQIKHHKDALQNLELAVKFSKGIDNKDFLQFVEKQIAYTYSYLGDYKNAFDSYKKSSLMKDSIFSAKKIQQVQELETKYRTKEKETENAILIQKQMLSEAEIKKQRWILLALVGGLGGLLFGFYFMNKRNNEKEKFINELAEKNIKIQALNKETVHRTKNYLNLAVSLLNKHKVESDDEMVIKALEENEKRLRVLSMLNSKLSGFTDGNSFSVNKYLTELIDDLVFSFNKLKSKSVEVSSAFDDIILGPEKCLYIGLIVNELVINSFKHAEVLDGRLLIDVKLVRNAGSLSLSYADNGIEKPSSNALNSQGKNLISDLVEQLHGSSKEEFDKGYRFTASI